MNIQIFGRNKCFDTKKAERWFKERRIPFQKIDLRAKGLARGEFNSIKQAVGLNSMLDESAAGAEIVKYLAYEDDKAEKLLEDPSLLKTPIVRNGQKATIGYKPEIWETWQ